VIKRIMVPLDGSGLAERALVVAGDLAESLAATIVIARVVPPLAPGRYSLALLRQVEDVQAEDAEAYLARVAKRLADDRLAVESRLLHGPVAETLAEQAAKERCDLIVLTSHGTSGLASNVFGSVAQKLLHSAPCPVLVVRSTGADLEGEEELEERRADEALISEARATVGRVPKSDR
jgi:nucleotide-binding universal stress UspA family protein